MDDARIAAMEFETESVLVLGRLAWTMLAVIVAVVLGFAVYGVAKSRRKQEG